MSKWILPLAFGLVLAMMAPNAYAISFGLDIPTSNKIVFENPTGDESHTADEVSGTILSVGDIFFFGVGIEDYTATYVDLAGSPPDEEDVEFNFKVTDLFLDVDIGPVSLIAGLGKGTVSADVGTVSAEWDLVQRFIRVGFWFAEFVEAHVGMIQGDAVTDETGFPDITFETITIGAKVGF